jgi:hypothetical protein
MSVGVMKDYKLKQRNLRASHTLGWFFVFFLVFSTSPPICESYTRILSDHAHCKYACSREQHTSHLETTWSWWWQIMGFFAVLCNLGVAQHAGRSKHGWAAMSRCARTKAEAVPRHQWDFSHVRATRVCTDATC